MDYDFCSQNVPPLLSHTCEIVYDQLLKEAGVPRWGLTILGLEANEVIVSATDPDGKQLTETIALTTDAQHEIQRLLLVSYERWAASRQDFKHP